MATKHHFVVVGEVTEDGNILFLIDHDTADVVFPEGTIWDETEKGNDTGGWVRPALKDVESLDIANRDIMLTDALASALGRGVK